MVHTSRFYQYASYEEFRDNGLFSTEANCIQFLYDMKILRTHQKCPSCSIPMTLTECPLSKYRDGSCWKCTCGRTIAPRVGSILQQSRITYKEFIKILGCPTFFFLGKGSTEAEEEGRSSVEGFEDC